MINYLVAIGSGSRQAISDLKVQLMHPSKRNHKGPSLDTIVTGLVRDRKEFGRRVCSRFNHLPSIKREATCQVNRVLHITPSQCPLSSTIQVLYPRPSLPFYNLIFSNQAQQSSITTSLLPIYTLLYKQPQEKSSRWKE